jgi:hypothetical protein
VERVEDGPVVAGTRRERCWLAHDRRAAGDPAADIGAFFGEYLRAWLQSIPITDPEDPGRLLAHAGLPLRRMRPALRAFWEAYIKYSSPTATELSRTLR